MSAFYRARVHFLFGRVLHAQPRPVRFLAGAVTLCSTAEHRGGVSISALMAIQQLAMGSDEKSGVVPSHNTADGRSALNPGILAFNLRSLLSCSRFQACLLRHTN